MHAKTGMLKRIAIAGIAATVLSSAVWAGEGRGTEKAGLKQLNDEVSKISAEVLTEHTGLEDQLKGLLEQRAALQELERQLAKAALEREAKLDEQLQAIENVEKQVAEHRKNYEEQKRKLGDLKGQLVRGGSDATKTAVQVASGEAAEPQKSEAETGDANKEKTGSR